MQLVGGHPYLVSESLYALRTSLGTIGELKRVALDEKGSFADHLQSSLRASRQCAGTDAGHDHVVDAGKARADVLRPS
jgi:hypothetical protein